MTKQQSFIEKELDKALQEIITEYFVVTPEDDDCWGMDTSLGTSKDVKEQIKKLILPAIQSALKELKKKKVCIRCMYDLAHDYDVEKEIPIHIYINFWSDIEEIFGK